ncbi:lysophospholipid acyltransferase family protein [Denitratisoma oestradiolicum]|uniref:Lipid A biosynthesis acyltransferase n=1 Tax=Denitratisoma oestradiolicum TaxID=311182 RepID=A0A6S6Y5I3_9PROT|nr:lipid A biosynthesis acyltransferase [Denitratisoma oestradiolicum]TWO81740.1 lipid A biosynthesis acyltransferase [Denitratisoma oestradiolicum]CAB1370690.1 Lipid A biosynthesis acyltransferase [Denitratisoma oestradiolicum]
MGRLGLALIWLLHWLPLSWQDLAGRALGRLLWCVNRERRHATLINLRLCLPQLDESARRRLARRHFGRFAATALERGLLWWSSPERLRRLIRIEGLERLQALEGKPLILLAPHFVGLDMGWSRLCLELEMVTMYARVKNPAFDVAIHRGRTRFGRQTLLSRQDGLRRVVAEIKAGRPFYYLPDLDYGRRDAVFAPFFGVPAATITGLSRLARLTGASVVPVLTRRDGVGYRVIVGEPWNDYPGEDPVADAARMNAYIEAQIRIGDGAEYLWSHKRFKTRPPGEKGVY